MITSGGGPGVWGLLHALRHMPAHPAAILVQDPDAGDTLGTLHADERACLPRVREAAYVERLLDTCRAHRVDVVIPVIDEELPRIAASRAAFETRGTRVLLAPDTLLNLCIDKAATHAALRETDFVPKFYLARTASEVADAIARLGYPSKTLCARPTQLAGGRGVTIIDPALDLFSERMLSKPGLLRCDAAEFLTIRQSGPENFPLIISEFLPGEEFGIDIYAEHGEVVAQVNRRKNTPVFHGNPMRMDFVDDAEIDAWTRRLVARIGGHGLMNIDARRDARGVLRLLEINPRPSACIGLSCGRMNLLALAIDRLVGGATLETTRYCAARPAERAMRALADIHIQNGCARVTAIHPHETQHAHFVPGRTS